MQKIYTSFIRLKEGRIARSFSFELNEYLKFSLCTACTSRMATGTGKYKIISLLWRNVSLVAQANMSFLSQNTTLKL